MNYLEIPPSPRLAKCVKRFWSLEYPSTESGGSPEPIIPDGCIEIIFNFSDRFRRYHDDGREETQAVSLVAGQMRKRVLIAPSGHVRLFGIRFLPEGAFPFFTCEMDEMNDRIEPLDSFWGRAAREIEDRLESCKSFGEQVAAAERFLIDQMSDRHEANAGVGRVIDLVTSSDGLFRVRELAKATDQTERTLERSFRRYVGLGPKAFSRIVRFQRVLRAIETGSDPGFVDAAYKYGYNDQSHLIKDFHQFAGMTPSEFVNKRSGITKILMDD